MMADLSGAKLVGICQNPEESRSFRTRQLPLYIDDITMIIEVSDPSTWQSCSDSLAPSGRSGSASPVCNLDEFRRKVLSLSNDELEDALCVDVETFNVLLSQLVPCVGCRKSVEKLYSDIGLYGYPSIRPMSINTDDCYLTAEWKTLKDPVKLHQLMVMNNHRVRSILEHLTKCRKNKRCALHSLDSHIHYRSRVGWGDLFAIMAKDCQEECCIIECDSLADMLDSYLLKHRFCGECKNKITRAYELLIGHEKTPADHHYNPALFKGIKHCVDDGHLHLKACPLFLDALTERAEPELCGSMRERHAKSLDIAQVEVLTCMALFMHDRLNRLISAVKTMQQTFQILYCVSVINLHNQFEVTWENKHGVDTTLERLCAELQGSAAPAGGKRRKKKNDVPKKNRKANSTGLLSDKCGDSHSVLFSGGDRFNKPSGRKGGLYTPSPPRVSDRVNKETAPTSDSINFSDQYASSLHSNAVYSSCHNRGEDPVLGCLTDSTNQRSRKYSRSMSPLGSSKSAELADDCNLRDVRGFGKDTETEQSAPLAAMEGTDLDLLVTDDEDDDGEDVLVAAPVDGFPRRTSWRSSFGKRRCSHSSHDLEDLDDVSGELHGRQVCGKCSQSGEHDNCRCPSRFDCDQPLLIGNTGGKEADKNGHRCDESGYSSVELSPCNADALSLHNDRKRRSSAASIGLTNGGHQKQCPYLLPNDFGELEGVMKSSELLSFSGSVDGCDQPDDVDSLGRDGDENYNPSDSTEIPLAEIEWFERNRSKVVQERREIRERLRGRFVEMQARLAATLPKVPQEA